MLNLDEVFADRKGMTMQIRTSYGAAHQGKFIALLADRVVLKGETPPPNNREIHVHIPREAIIEVADLGFTSILTAPGLVAVGRA